MIALLPILALSLAQNVAAAQWRISWALAQAQVGVNYRVCRVVGSSMTTLGTTAGASLVINANSGDQISVVAFNELGEATPSVPITLPAPSGRIFAVTIQASIDPQNPNAWQNVTILLPEEMTANGQSGPRLFIRQKTNP